MIGRFHVLGILGRGGSGVVCAAYDDVLGRRVAIKVIDPSLVGPDLHRRARLLCEARTMARMSHPNVVPVLEAGITAEGRVFVVMELVEGGTLRSWLSERPRSSREVADKLHAAGQGLAAAHAAGIVHRDFKLDNVLVGTDGRVRVTDFGIARCRAGALGCSEPSSWADDSTTGVSTTGATRDGEVLGTPGTMAPGQLHGRRVDVRADVFAFCVAIHDALYGRVPLGLHRMIAQGLAADPGARPKLDAVLVELARRPSRGRWTLLLSAGVALSMLALVCTREATGTRPTASHGVDAIHSATKRDRPPAPPAPSASASLDRSEVF